MSWSVKPLSECPLLCPVNWLRVYIARTSAQCQRGTLAPPGMVLDTVRPRARTVENQIKPLFVKVNSSVRASRQLLSSWIRAVIVEAYRAADSQGTETGLAETRSTAVGELVSPSTEQGSSPDHSSTLVDDDPALGPRLTRYRTGRGNAQALPRSSSVQLRPRTVTGIDSVNSLDRADTVQVSRVDEDAPPSTVRDHLGSANMTPPSRVVRRGSPVLSRPAHELRALAATLAYCRGAALTDVIPAVGWRSSCTFANFYLREMEVLAPNRVAQAVSPATRRSQW